MKRFAESGLGRTMLVATVLAAAMLGSGAQDTVKPSAAPTPTSPASSAPATPVQLSAPVQDVLKLVQAKVGEDTILAYVNNSTASFNLNASDVVYLREQGASDRVITGMLNHHYTPPPTPPQAAPANAAPAQSASTDQTATQAAAQPSTVYVTSPSVYPYYYYPNYYPYYYYPYYYPSASFVFGYSYYGGHYHGYCPPPVNHGGFHGGHHH